ncbi:outer mitochondrial membrane transport complex protein-domain-containing protein [Lipomyces oligophaga]|uniref:outer mitochondrial membrane transport complex protein-domain-containing protein n=1 Tax=Lipomyces oligophaga TaxID=45792 RepID=UPI0034CE5697
MTYKLHVWGTISPLASFDADCLAVIIYLHFCNVSNEQVVVVPSSNPLISATGALPALRKENELVASGLADVLRYLKTQGITSSIADPRSIALQVYIPQKFTPISLYIERVHILHNRTWFRPALVKLVPTPASYIASMNLFSEAKYSMSHIYDIEAATADRRAENEFKFFFIGIPLSGKPRAMLAEQSPQQAGVPQEIIDRVKDSALGKRANEEVGAVLRLLAYSAGLFKTIEETLKLQDHEDGYLFGTTPSEADACLLAQLMVMLAPEYDVPFIDLLIRGMFPLLSNYYDRHMKIIQDLNSMISTDPIPPQDLYTLSSIVLQYL